MQPECLPAQLCFEGVGRRRVEGRFGGRLATDGGVLLLREVDRRYRVTERLAGCFRDRRSAARIKHRLETLVAQWVRTPPNPCRFGWKQPERFTEVTM